MNKELNLRYFTPKEFIRNGTGWYGMINTELLCRLDCLRGVWGDPIHLSKHTRAIGRDEPVGAGYQAHNYRKWKEVRGVDCFPQYRSKTPRQFYDLAMKCGLSVGAYPNWSQGKLSYGFHLDVGRSSQATWGWTGEFVDIESVL